MSISHEGLHGKAKTTSITLSVLATDVLIKLCNALDFNHIAQLTMPDVQKTKKGFWWLGRKLYLRIHLSVLILQCLLKRSDREKAISKMGINTDGIQRPANIKNQPRGEEIRQLINPRAGIEPLIGHVNDYIMMTYKLGLRPLCKECFNRPAYA